MFSAISFASKGQMQFYTQKNVAWQPHDTNTYFLILKNNKNCLKCFTEVSQFLAENYSGKNYIKASVSKTDSSVFARKYEAAEIGRIMPEVSLILFDYNRENEVQNAGSVFIKNNIDITPCLLVIKGDKQFFYRYEQLYVGKLINRGVLSEINKQIAQ